MNSRRLVAAMLPVAVYLFTGADAQSGDPPTYEGWKAHVLENKLVRLHVVPEIGGRVIQYTLGDKEFFWVSDRGPRPVGDTRAPSCGRHQTRFARADSHRCARAAGPRRRPYR